METTKLPSPESLPTVRRKQVDVAFTVVPDAISGLHIGDTIAFHAATHNMHIRFLGPSPFERDDTQRPVYRVDQKDTLELEVVREGKGFLYVVEMLRTEGDQPSFTTPCIDIP